MFKSLRKEQFRELQRFYLKRSCLSQKHKAKQTCIPAVHLPRSMPLTCHKGGMINRMFTAGEIDLTTGIGNENGSLHGAVSLLRPREESLNKCDGYGPL